MSSVGTGRLPISAFCVWEIPDRGIAVHLHLSTVEWLDYEIRERLRAQEGAEMGGLLLGRIDSRTWNKITIEGFTPVLCEHESGSFYHLSQSDKDLLQEQVVRWQRGPGRNLYVVGFYRSHNREDFSLDAEDLSLAREFFSDSKGVFLLIKPVGQRVRVGGLFLCDEGHVDRECNVLFPFSRSRLTRGETTLDSLPEREEQEMPEGAAATYFAPGEGEFEPGSFAPKPSRSRGQRPSEEREFEPGAYTQRPSAARGQPLPEEREFEPESFARKSSLRESQPASEESESEPGPFTARPSAMRGDPAAEEGEFEPEAFVSQPSPRRDPIPAEETEFEPEAYTARASTKRGRRPPKGKEFDLESYAGGPVPRRSHFPPEENEIEPEELFPQVAEQAELEFLPIQHPVFGTIESETPRWRSWARMLLVAILILAVGAASYQLLRESEVAKSLAGLLSGLGITSSQVTLLQPAALGLEVQLVGDSFRVGWNKDLPSIATATRGFVLITDGDSKRDVRVGADQLRTGSVFLSHDTSEVTVRFRVIGANGETVETTAVPAVNSSAAAGSGESATESREIPTIKIDRSPSRSARGSGTKAQTENSRRNRRPEAARPPQLSLARATPPPTSPAPNSRITLPPPQVSSPGAVEQKPAEAQRDDTKRPQTAAAELTKPASPPAETASAPQPSETTQRPVVEPPPKVTEPVRQPDSARTALQQPPPISTTREPTKSVALPEKIPTPAESAPTSAPPAPVTRGDYIPPRPVRQVKPATPSNVRNLISEDVQINVRVEIDATGRVTRAEPILKGKRDYLTSLALEAARQWRFSPARQGSQNVSSSTVVGFQFKKD